MMAENKRKRGDDEPTTSTAINTKSAQQQQKKKKKKNEGGAGKSRDERIGARRGAGEEQFWSKSKKKRMRRMRAMQKKQPQKQQQEQQEGEKKEKITPKKGDEEEKEKDGNTNVDNSDDNDSGENGNDDEESKKLLQTLSFSTSSFNTTNSRKKQSSSLQKSFIERLSGSRFRELNEELYTTHSSSAYQKFSSQPELFQQYHDGFKQQVLSWPTNPVDLMLRSIVSLHQKKKGKGKEKMVVADFGCGEAKLASELLSIRNDDVSQQQPPKKKKQKRQKKSKDDELSSSSHCPFEVHSFDLVSGSNPLITPCDMSNVPLQSNTVNVGVFCLALMGTNIDDFIREAHRVLKEDGLLKIAEVRSRFESSANSGSDAPLESDASSTGGLDEFLEVMKTLGFDCKTLNRSNKMFVMMDFVKNGVTPSKEARFTAKPCIYKRR